MVGALSTSAERRGFTGPVFLVGVVRSGTKLLRDLMNRNPAIGIPPSESHFIPGLIDCFGHSADFTNDRTLRRLYAHLRGTNFFTNMRDRGVELSWDDLACVEDRGSWCSILTHVFRFYAPTRRHEGFVWGDKTPTYARHISLLKSLFPEARFIHIHRDPRDCCLSARKAWGKSVYRAANEWRKTIDIARASGRSLGPDYLEVSYEGLLADPAVVLRNICRFVDRQFVPDMVSLDRPAEDLGDTRESVTVVSDNLRKYRRELPVREVRRIEEIVRPTARALGYELDHDVSFRPVGRIVSPLLTAHDALASAKFYGRRKGLLGGLSYIWRFHSRAGWVADHYRSMRRRMLP